MAEVIERRSELKTVTPMMRQYLDVKEEYPDYILFYRLGDFYECFFDNANDLALYKADGTLGVAYLLTYRNLEAALYKSAYVDV